MILNQKDSKAALKLCDNKDCATPNAMDLPDGDKNAERVMVSKHRKTSALKYSVCAPWCLSEIFSL